MVHMHAYVLRGWWCAAQIVRASARGGGGGAFGFVVPRPLRRLAHSHVSCYISCAGWVCTMRLAGRAFRRSYVIIF